MNNIKVVILNAPPNAGKDVVAEYFCSKSRVYHHMKFKKPLFDIAIATAQIDPAVWWGLYEDRILKETPDARLFNRSPRDHMIHCSEKLIKPVYGKEYFGEVFAMGLQEGINIASDGGFIEELRPTVRKIGVENILILRLHREGCSFEGDSRDYLYNTGCNEGDINNNGTLQDLFDNVDQYLMYLKE